MGYHPLPHARLFNHFRVSVRLLVKILIGVPLLLTAANISSASFAPAGIPAAATCERTVIPRSSFTESSTKVRLCSVEAFSEECGDCGADKAMDGNLTTRWSSKFQDPQWITVTLCEEKTINRLILYWETAYGKYYQIHVSRDGETWYKVFSTASGDGDVDVITFAPITARYVRMCGFVRGTQWGYSLWELEVFETDASPVYPTPFPPILKGYYPRWFYKELNYWTVVGSPDSHAEILFSDDGMVGNPRNGFSLMPYLRIAEKMITALDVTTVTHCLEDGYLPFPELSWLYGDIKFSQRVFPYEAGTSDSHSYVWYSLENKGSLAITGSFYLTIRPFQVRPPWVFGGIQKNHSIEAMADDRRIKVNGRGGFLALTTPDGFGAIAYEDGDIMDDVVEFIGMGILPATRTATSTGGYASAALEYRYSLRPGEKRDFIFAIPMDKSLDESDLPLTPAEVLDAWRESKAVWEDTLNRALIDLPNQEVVQTLRSNVAYIMVNKDGYALQPGSDNYDRSWMRDGAEMGLALLKMGHYTDVKDYLNWVASFQRENGLIPPVIDPDGGMTDVDEWDSQGQFIFLVSEYYNFTKDRAFLERIFPNVVSATVFLKNLREQRRTPEFEGTRFYGILPPSISHEGYPEPKHSYWDDLWALKGWKEARQLAAELERYELVPGMDEEYRDFSACFVSSITRTMETFCTDYIPGSADDGDFDAISMAIAAWLTDQTDLLEDAGLLPALLYTLDKYYHEVFLSRLEHGWQFGYTPYELRVASAYLRLGQKDKALRILYRILEDRRPLAWNQWAEVVYPRYRDPGYIGDMPHSWIGAIYINLVRDLFVHERDGQLILGNGIDERWLAERGRISMARFPTHFGEIGYTLVNQGDVLRISFNGAANPERGFVFKLPFSGRPIIGVKMDGQDWNHFTAHEIYFDTMPREVLIFFASRKVCVPLMLKNYYPKVAIATHHGRYVTAMSSCPLLKQESWLRDCGLFTLQRLADGKVALVTCRNMYVTAPVTGMTDQDWALKQETALGECGKFTLRELGNGQFALETCARRYVTALDGNRSLKEQWLMIAGANEVWEWEQLTLIGCLPK